MTIKKINFQAELKRAWEVALMKKSAMNHVAEGGKAETTFGYYVILASAILMMIGSYFFLPSFLSLGLGYALKLAIIQIVSAVVGIYVISFIAKTLFKGKAKHDAFFRVMAYGYLVTWLGLVPGLSVIGGIWLLILTFVFLKAIHKLSTGGAIGTLVVTLIAGMVIGSILTIAGFSTGFGSDFSDYSSGFKINTSGSEGSGSIEMKDGKMTIKGPDGEVVEIKIPTN